MLPYKNIPLLFKCLILFEFHELPAHCVNATRVDMFKQIIKYVQRAICNGITFCSIDKPMAS